MPGVIAAPLRSRRARRKIGFADDEDRPIPVMAEINLRFGGGRAAAFDRLDDLWGRVAGGRPPRRVAGQYAAGDLSMRQVERLVAADAVPVAWRGRSVYRIWPDFPVRLHVDASCVTVKADAARRAFNAYGDDIVWAVVDTGIAKDHPHFAAYHTLDHPRRSTTCTATSPATASPPRTVPSSTRPGTARTSPASSPARSARGWPRSRSSGPCAPPRTGTTRRTRGSR